MRPRSAGSLPWRAGRGRMLQLSCSPIRFRARAARGRATAPTDPARSGLVPRARLVRQLVALRRADRARRRPGGLRQDDADRGVGGARRASVPLAAVRRRGHRCHRAGRALRHRAGDRRRRRAGHRPDAVRRLLERPAGCRRRSVLALASRTRPPRLGRLRAHRHAGRAGRRRPGAEPARGRDAPRRGRRAARPPPARPAARPHRGLAGDGLPGRRRSPTRPTWTRRSRRSAAPTGPSPTTCATSCWPLSLAERTFLRRTSILARLTAAACDAVPRRVGSGRCCCGWRAPGVPIEPLDRADLALPPAPVARRRCCAPSSARTEPELERELHRRAARWFAARATRRPRSSTPPPAATRGSRAGSRGRSRRACRGCRARRAGRRMARAVRECAPSGDPRSR